MYASQLGQYASAVSDTNSACEGMLLPTSPTRKAGFIGLLDFCSFFIISAILKVCTI
jgi:hypothetical protein